MPEEEYEPAPKVHPRLAADVLDMLPPRHLLRQVTHYVADHGWDAYARDLAERLRPQGWTMRLLRQEVEAYRVRRTRARLADRLR